MSRIDTIQRFNMNGIKLRSNTSLIVDDRIYYIVKKFPDGKPSKLYAAYDFKSGICVGYAMIKDDLIKWLQKRSGAIEREFKKIGE